MPMAGIIGVHPEFGEGFAIITIGPNNLMKPIHSRMPVILSPKDFEAWLDPDNSGDDVKDLLKHYNENMDATPVSPKVGNVKNKGQELVEEHE